MKTFMHILSISTSIMVMAIVLVTSAVQYHHHSADGSICLGICFHDDKIHIDCEDSHDEHDNDCEHHEGDCSLKISQTDNSRQIHNDEELIVYQVVAFLYALYIPVDGIDDGEKYEDFTPDILYKFVLFTDSPLRAPPTHIA